MNNKRITPLFSTPLYTSNIGYSEAVLDYIKKIEYIRSGPDKNTTNGYCSKNIALLNVPELILFKKSILQEISYFLNEQLSFSNEIKFNITTSWATKHDKGDYSQPHHHSNSLYSGIVYLQVDDNSGDIIFCNKFKSPLYPQEINIEIKEFNILNSSTWAITPKNNDILIFPSHLTHEVTPSKSDQLRYALAFNIFPSGILNKNSISELQLL